MAKLDRVTGADHTGTIDRLGTGRADAVLTWFEAWSIGDPVFPPVVIVDPPFSR
jgi:hypothetical protein